MRKKTHFDLVRRCSHDSSVGGGIGLRGGLEPRIASQPTFWVRLSIPDVDDVQLAVPTLLRAGHRLLSAPSLFADVLRARRRSIRRRFAASRRTGRVGRR